MTGYTAMYPINVAVDDKVKKFIEAFYAVSDDEVRNVEWVDCFADDAILIMGDKRAEGIEGMSSGGCFHLVVSLWLGLFDDVE
jgi:hypothetical protein